jgi:DNA-binding response OmpR family regulator
MAITHQPDMIILDLMMPTASGDSALKFMRGTPELANMPILVVSAHSDVAQISRQLGADGWLAKPITIDELTQRINAMLSAPRPS